MLKIHFCYRRNK